MEKNFENNNENVIEFLTGQDKLTFTFTWRKWINKVKKLKEEHPDEVEYIENSDGSICGSAPIGYFKFSPTRKVDLTEAQRQAKSEHMKKVRANYMKSNDGLQ